jgi:hypothetical protein
LGPGSVLAGLIKKIDRGVNVFSVEDEAGLNALMVGVESPPSRGLLRGTP